MKRTTIGYFIPVMIFSGLVMFYWIMAVMSIPVEWDTNIYFTAIKIFTDKIFWVIRLLSIIQIVWFGYWKLHLKGY